MGAAGSTSTSSASLITVNLKRSMIGAGHATASDASTAAAFSSSQFRASSKQLVIEDTCTNLELKGTYLHAECLRLDGSTTHSEIDLDQIIGFVDGRLEWDLTGFSKYCSEYSLDGYFLVVKYRLQDSEIFETARLDLRLRIYNSDGILTIFELNKKVSVMLSEAPWMKFKVIAEPDLNVFANHPVMRETLIHIAETTAEHVTIEMHKSLTLAMEAAITAVTASAMSHVSSQMDTLIQNAVGYASTSPSITGAESLHLYNGGAYTGGVGLSYGSGGIISSGGGQIIAGGGQVSANLNGGDLTYASGGGQVSGSLSGGGLAYAGNGITTGYLSSQRQEEQTVTKDERSSSYSEIKKDTQVVVSA